jgi:hypothetical protein
MSQHHSHKHKARKLRAKVDRMRAENRGLRSALKAEHALWWHLRDCSDCQMQTLHRLMCPDATALRHAARALGRNLTKQKK